VAFFTENRIKPSQRHQVQQEIRGSEVEGPAVAFTWDDAAICGFPFNS
jgi:hypothetical protein